MSVCDLSRLRLGDPRCSIISQVAPRRAPYISGKFLKGPIPMEWLWAASRLQGRALHVGIELWFRSGIQRSPTVRFSVSRLATCIGTGRATVTRGLQALDAAKLVAVVHQKGRRSSVTILALPSVPDRVPIGSAAADSI